MDLQIGNLPWAIWFERMGRDECLNAVAEDSHNLTLKPSYIFHKWESLPDVKENQAALAKFEFLWQRNSSASFDVTQPPSRGDNFCKLFLSVLKSGYISAVQFYFCLCDQAL